MQRFFRKIAIRLEDHLDRVFPCQLCITKGQGETLIFNSEVSP